VNQIKPPGSGGQDQINPGQDRAAAEAWPQLCDGQNSEGPRVSSGTALRKGQLIPADKVALAYLTITSALILAFYDRVAYWWLLVSGHLIAMGVIVAMARWVNPRQPNLDELQSLAPDRAPSFLRSWYPLVLIPLSYKELGYLIPLIHPHDFDRELALIDQRMIGVDPVVWLDRINHPALTLIMQLSYLTYYVMPILLGFVLWHSRRFKEFHFFLFVILLGFYVSYLGYILVPAIGPRFFLGPADVKPFEGPGVAAIRSFLDRMEGVTRDCFPSGHTELTLLVLFCAWQFHRKLFYILAPVGSALIFSTVYLRYHYVIDVLAGAATAFAIAFSAACLHKAAGGASLIDRRGTM
jgi:membrane-associated phospholipid phosphatase